MQHAHARARAHAHPCPPLAAPQALRTRQKEILDVSCAMCAAPLIRCARRLQLLVLPPSHAHQHLHRSPALRSARSAPAPRRPHRVVRCRHVLCELCVERCAILGSVACHIRRGGGAMRRAVRHIREAVCRGALRRAVRRRVATR
eukprot:2038598-Prymnesium_polylepis.1